MTGGLLVAARAAQPLTARFGPRAVVSAGLAAGALLPGGQPTAEAGTAPAVAPPPKDARQ